MLTRYDAGLDIGSHAIKLVKLAVRSGTTRAVACDQILTPPGSVVGREVVQPQVIKDALVRLVRRQRLTRCRLAVAVGGDNLVMRCVQLPEMNDDELRAVIPWEADKYLPIAGADAVMDWAVVSRQDGQMEVLLVSSYRSMVDRQLEAVLGAGVCPDAIEPDQVALARVVMGRYDDGDAAVVIDIGMCSTRLVVVQNSVPILARSFQPGLGEMIRRVATEMAGDERSARDVIWQEGVRRGAVEAVARDLVVEVRQSLDFFFNQDRITRIGLLVLVGGGAVIPGICDVMDRLLRYASGVQGERVLPGCSQLAVTVTLGENSQQVLGPQYASALGLALGRRM